MSEQEDGHAALGTALAKRVEGEPDAAPPVPVASDDVQALEPTERMGPPQGSIEGIGKLVVTAKQRDIIMAAIDADGEVDIRADGIPYMPHIFIRQRLLKAFGPGGWGLRAERTPGYDRALGCVFWDGSLWAKGKYIARAVGQCKWQPTNRKMTQFDALEGARSDCLTRCCKDLGIGWELWDPAWRKQWIATHAESYWATNWKTKKKEKRWRLKNTAGEPSDDTAEAVADRAAKEHAENPDLAGNGGAGDSLPAPGSPSSPISAPPTCPKCEADMVLRNSQRGQFWGCSTYPDCRGTRQKHDMPNAAETEGGNAAETENVSSAQQPPPSGAATALAAARKALNALRETLGISIPVATELTDGKPSIQMTIEELGVMQSRFKAYVEIYEQWKADLEQQGDVAETALEGAFGLLDVPPVGETSEMIDAVAVARVLHGDVPASDAGQASNPPPVEEDVPF